MKIRQFSLTQMTTTVSIAIEQCIRLFYAHSRKTIYTFACCSLLSCGAEPRPEKAEDLLISMKQAFARQNNVEYDAALDMMLQRMELELANADNTEDATFDILVLHGGGAAGGFAAGFLKGWGEIRDPENQRPVFDYVTGASSGALLAPLAYIGTEQAYQLAYDVALEPPVFKTPGYFSLWPTRSSILPNTQLAEGIDSVFDAEVVQLIADGAREHRALLIGGTDLDLGMGRVWDLAYEAGSLPPDQAVERARQVLLASTAIPGFFPPVEIDGHLYTDGGVAATMFLGMDAFGVKKVAQQWRQRHPNLPMPVIRIWAIINAKMYVDPRVVQAQYPDIAMRSINIMMAYDRMKALFTLAYLVEEMKEVDGVRAEFRHVFIPDEATIPVDVTQLGDKDIIRRLVDLGYRMGADPVSWTEGAPQVHRLPESGPAGTAN